MYQCRFEGISFLSVQLHPGHLDTPGKVSHGIALVLLHALCSLKMSLGAVVDPHEREHCSGEEDCLLVPPFLGLQTQGRAHFCHPMPV